MVGLLSLTGALPDVCRLYIVFYISDSGRCIEVGVHSLKMSGNTQLFFLSLNLKQRYETSKNLDQG